MAVGKRPERVAMISRVQGIAVGGVARGAVGRHRAMSGRRRWLRRRTPAVIPAQRLRDIELVCAQTKLTHLVSADELVTGHQRGDYVALCGARFLAACLVEPGRGWCGECASE
jgi:hypothetical protein